MKKLRLPAVAIALVMLLCACGGKGLWNKGIAKDVPPYTYDGKLDDSYEMEDGFSFTYTEVPQQSVDTYCETLRLNGFAQVEGLEEGLYLFANEEDICVSLLYAGADTSSTGFLLGSETLLILIYSGQPAAGSDASTSQAASSAQP